jgi:hypothetical protein
MFSLILLTVRTSSSSTNLATNRTSALFSQKLVQSCFVRRRYAHDPDFILLPARSNFNALLFPVRAMMDQQGVTPRYPYSPSPPLSSTSSLKSYQVDPSIESQRYQSLAVFDLFQTSAGVTHTFLKFVALQSAFSWLSATSSLRHRACLQHVRHCARTCCLSMGTELAFDTPLPSGEFLYTLP